MYRHAEAPAPADVPPRRPGRDGRDAVPGRDGSRARGAVSEAAVPVRGDLHPERDLSAACGIRTRPAASSSSSRSCRRSSRIRSHLVTISGMKAPDGNPDMGGMHMGASAAWLNGIGPVTDQAKFVVKSKKSIDQFIADKIAEDTPLRSLEVGTEDMGTSAGACDGYPCVFFNAVSWRDDTSPLPMAVNPRVTFERIFGEAGSTARRVANMRRKQSLLDSVVEEAAPDARQPRPGRQRDPRRVPDQHPRRRAAARSDGGARRRRARKARSRRSACPTTSTTT